jgi:DNA-binding CsgD family transcriptional regulator
VQSSILERLAPRYDGIVEQIYRAGSGLAPWLEPLGEMARVFGSWSVQMLGVNKQTGSMTFSYETGTAPPAAPVEYLRYYHRIDPRLSKHLPAPAGVWFSCEEHFDEAFVERDPFYQEYLIPYGGRYLYGSKLHDDEGSTILIGNLGPVGKPQLTAQEKEAFRRLADHCGKALDIEQALAEKAGAYSVGAELLEKMRQPMILVDSHRRITYRNRNAAQLFERGHLVRELDGRITCRDGQSDLDFTIALRELALVPISTHGDIGTPAERRSVRLRSRDGKTVIGTLLALRPESTMGSFGRQPLALFTLFEPGATIDIDPFVLSATFDLTPAEARLAALVVNGRTPEECAKHLNVKISTVRSQLVSVYGKTGAGGQTDLVRMILSATAV